MKTEVAAEWFWTRHRHAFQVTVLISLLLVVGVVVARFLSTSSDVASAVTKAEEIAADAASHGLELPVSATYVEPRYQLAMQMPLDIAGLTLAMMLVGLVGAALAVGSEWRTGTIRLAFVTPSARARPTLARLVVWWATWTALGTAGLVLATVGLMLVGHVRGLSDGLGGATILGLTARGGLVVGAGVVVGASLATILRSDAAVVVLVLSYVLVAEIVLPALLATRGYLSPGVRLLDVVVSSDLTRPVVMSCGPVPRCETVYESTSGSPGTSGALFGGIGLTLSLAVWRARMPVWR